MSGDDRKLIREFVRLLNEDDYGGFDVSGAMADSPYGASFGSGEDLYKVFVEPFTDVVNTAVGKGKEVSQKVQTLGKVAFETLATSLIPVLESDYEEIFAQEKEQLDKIKSQYSDIYNSTWQAFKNHDFLASAFLMAPSAMITAKVAQQAPVQTIKMLNVLSGGRLDKFLAKVSKALHLDVKASSGKQGPGLPEGKRYTTLQELHKKKQTAGDILTQKKIKQVVDNNPQVIKMREETKKAVEGALNKVLERAQAITSAKSVEDLEHKLGKKLKGADKLAQVPQQERQALEKVLLQGLKKSALSMYIKDLQKQAQAMTKEGVPNDHPMVQMISTTISKLKAAA